MIFDDCEVISVENLVNDAIKNFKELHPSGTPSAPPVWEDILKNIESANTSPLCWSETTENGSVIHIKTP